MKKLLTHLPHNKYWFFHDQHLQHNHCLYHSQMLHWWIPVQCKHITHIPVIGWCMVKVIETYIFILHQWTLHRLSCILLMVRRINSYCNIMGWNLCFKPLFKKCSWCSLFSNFKHKTGTKVHNYLSKIKLELKYCYRWMFMIIITVLICHTSWIIADENPNLHNKIFSISLMCCLLNTSGTTSTALWN